MTPECAPWTRDHRPQNWVPVAYTASYFRRTVLTIKRQIKSGHLARRGIPSYWDGTKWWVRLPDSVLVNHIKPLQSVRSVG
jgi:hypothetical protein